MGKALSHIGHIVLPATSKVRHIYYFSDIVGVGGLKYVLGFLVGP